MFPFPLTNAVLCQSPLLLIDGNVYVKTRQSTLAGETLVTAFGVSHPLRRVWTIANLQSRWRQTTTREAREFIESELTRLMKMKVGDPLTRFLRLADEAQLHDFALQREIPLLEPQFRPPPDINMSIDSAAETAPPLELPQPALCILRRLWLLKPDPRVALGMTYVRRQEGLTLRPTGEYVRLNQLHNECDRIIRDHCLSAATRLAGEYSVSTEQSDIVVHAFRLLQRFGYVQIGSLLFLPSQSDGYPARVGYVLPPHFNSTLNRHSMMDLAITSVFGAPPQIGQLALIERISECWRPVSLRNGLCLGAGPPSHALPSAALAFVGYLRWAAIRLAQNGKFHERDGGTSAIENEIQYYS